MIMIKHGDSYKRLYRIWSGIKQRCNNKKCVIYNRYGGKGIKIYKKWNDSYVEFRDWALVNGYKNNLTIDRVNNKKGYYPGNCRWATDQQQNTNMPKLSTNTSGYTGLSWSKKDRRWLCVISIKNKSKRIGAYKTQKEAVMARNKFIKKHKLNHATNTYIGERVNNETKQKAMF
ncbi:MAG: hypothetical protein GY928_22295 [Colwellia sp.]|nr:hypothetical protein [Colwellia sp.]